MLIFDGTEVPSNRILLEGMGVPQMGLSFYRLWKRGLPKTKQYLIEDRFPEITEVYVDSGWQQVSESDMTAAELEDYAAEYQDFIVVNAGRISGATELWLPQREHDWNIRQREFFWSECEHLFWPVWQKSMGYPALMSLAERFEHVAIPHSTVEEETTLSARVNALVTQHQTSFHGLSIAKPDNLRAIRWDTVSTLSWLSPMRRGETIVWDGSRLVRYPARMKDQARMRYRSQCEKAGLDFKKITDDDPNEVTRLAIWSYLQMELAMAIGSPFHEDDEVVTNSDYPAAGELVESPPGDVANRASGVRKPPEPREPSETGPLPVFGVQYKTIVDTDENGNQVLREVPVVQSTSQSLRQCNTCFVASNCPAFKPDSVCAFNLPVEVKTKEQLRSLLNAIVEMQGQRVAFGRFSEEMNGGYPDPNVGLEIDRLFKLVKVIKELEDNREFIRITAERQGAGGVLSALFGDRAASLRDLPNGGLDADTTNRIIDGGPLA
jgi:hypothetical protein